MASVMESSRLGGFVTSYENVNFSTAKQKFTFGKGNRFPSISKVMNQTIQYNLGSTRSKRTCSFGIGQRFSTPMATRSSKSLLF